jgi:aminoglycoside phosphotransferase (APT) family kinase protein
VNQSELAWAIQEHYGAAASGIVAQCGRAAVEGGQGEPRLLSFSEDWTALVDLGRLQAWMGARGLVAGSIESAAPIAGGTQNLLLRFSAGGRAFVLRRPAGDPRPGAEAAMGREARILQALAQTAVPHPRLVAACDDAEIIGAPFYVMENVEGFNAALGLPQRFAEDAGWRERMAFALIEGAAALAQVDVDAIGLGGLGRPEGFLERQVSRWLGQLGSYEQYEGWPGATELPGVEALASWVDANRPTTFTKGLMHGDYHIANVLFHSDRPELAAIVDWELATVGDPLIDLGWMLATWPDPDGMAMGEQTPIKPWSGFPTRDELAARYAEASGRNIAAVRWYEVFACFKLGVMLEGTYARAMSGRADAALGQNFHERTLALFKRAQRLLQA